MPACAASAATTAEAPCSVMHVPKKLAYCNPARDTSVWASIMVPCSPSLQYLHTCMKIRHNRTLPNRGARARNSVRKNALEVELA
jgi:hypothetical protein